MSQPMYQPMSPPLSGKTALVTGGGWVTAQVIEASGGYKL